VLLLSGGAPVGIRTRQGPGRQSGNPPGPHFKSKLSETARLTPNGHDTKERLEVMKRFLGIALGTLLSIGLMALPVAAAQGDNENEQEHEQEFEQFHQEFEQEFEQENENEQEFEHELEHIMGTLVIAFGGEFEVRAAGMDDKFVVRMADDHPNHWFQVEVEDKDEVAEFETETNILTIKDLKVNGVVQPNVNMQFILHDDGTLEKIQ
jgi:hypothetical protein